ncbi:hypothetical protein QBZ16_000509 [Prototheca wickerhamii]|uniref:SAM-dependent MTase RsmB/NOP-type domain-containing protein n=1 Tax=Prototheca wickerhamii TaxID=3111 RepID=A0AAD9MM51_PROWI|nr:hypothetical protein QBZ16_000509 [Prototheca wickerhamii]
MKSLTLGPHIQAKRATHAVTVETVRHLFLLRKVVAASGVLERFPRLTESVAYVLAYDALLGEGIRPIGGAERAVLKCKEIEAELKQAKYRGVQRDPILESVLLLPAGTDLHDFAPVRDGRAVLQSRASCFPACALAPPRGAKLLDACAAPGNKTTQLAAAVGPGGRVLALDKDKRRVQRLRETVDRAGAASIVETRCDDFLTLDPAQHADVEAILLDPSCSGTGTEAGRLDAMLRDGGESAEASELSVAPEEAERIEALAAFQRRALEHALSFPGVQRISYSTCSIHAEENEMVVQAVEKVARERGFVLARALPSWPRRGLPDLDPSQSGAGCI